MEKTKPAFDVRLGDFKATFWSSEFGGVTRYNVTVSQITKENEQVKTHDATQWLSSMIAASFDLLEKKSEI